MCDEAVKALNAAMEDGYGYPRSSNLPGRKAQQFIEDANALVANFFGGVRALFYYDGEVANGLSVLSMGRIARKGNRNHIVSSPVEHTSVIAALRILEGEGSRITFMEIDSNGRIVPEALREAMTDETGLVITAWASSVSGVIQTVEEFAEIAHSNGALFHSDARDAAGRIEINLSDTEIDVITICSHKIGGPPGAGAVIMTDIDPWMMSAAPGFSGMMNIPGISGMIAAIDVIGTGIIPRTRIVNRLRKDILDGFASCRIKYSLIGDDPDNLLPGTALMILSNVPEKLHSKLENADIVLPSHNSTERLAYLRVLGRDVLNPDSYLGFSINPRNTSVDIEHFVRTVSEICCGSSGRKT